MLQEEESLPHSPAPEESNIVEQLTATRSPTLSTRMGRSTEHLQNFLEGKSRLSYVLNPDLEKSLSSPDTSLIDEENVQEKGEPCRRGCTPILKRLAKIFACTLILKRLAKRLAKIFNDVGRHNATTHAAYMKSYPNPKKEAMAYRNLTNRLYCDLITAYLSCSQH